MIIYEPYNYVIYVYKIINKRNRSLFGRLRAGCLDLELKQVDGEVLPGRTEYTLYVIVESRMEFILVL